MVKREIKVIINMESDEPVIIQADDVNPIKDMACLCEALCTLIHAAHKNGIRKDHESLKLCIGHLESGFADENYKVRLPGEQD